MNYYEELGLSQQAREDEIRRAHRQLSRLLHPDFQTNPETRGLALIQMSRINVMVDTLLDPRRRSEYDQDLRSQVSAAPHPDQVARPHPAIRYGVRRGSALSLLGTVAVAVSLTAGTLWFLGGDMLRLRTTAERQQQNSYPRIAGDETRITSPVTTPIPSPSGPLHAVPTLAGLWIYSSSFSGSDSPDVSPYEPEYIQLRIDVENSVLRGEYAARYRVPDSPVSSEVAFVFEGRRDALSFPWAASDGTRGRVNLKMIGAHLLEVSWRVGIFGTRIGLGGGTAVLTRRIQP